MPQSLSEVEEDFGVPCFRFREVEHSIYQSRQLESVPPIYASAAALEAKRCVVNLLTGNPEEDLEQSLVAHQDLFPRGEANAGNV